jgi:Bacteriocin-protection, YdeI or OmpD-Associated
MKDMPQFFVDALVQDQEARTTFLCMGKSHKAEFKSWLEAAQSSTERLLRVHEALDMLAGRDGPRRH